MAYLIFDGVDDYVNLPTPIAAIGDVNVTDYVFEFKVDLKDALTYIGKSGSTTKWLFRYSDGLFIAGSSGIELRYEAGNAITGLTLGNIYTFRITKPAGTNVHTLLVVETGLTRTATLGANLRFERLGNGDGTNFGQLDLYYLSFTDNVDPKNSRYLDPLASGGTGLVLPDTANNLDGDLVGFTDGTQWGGSFAVTDTTAPVITVDGAASTTISIGQAAPTFTATASDDTDGDITANIVVGGDTVDPNTVGTYTITYDVSDAALNAATQVTRTVIVQASSLNMTLNGIPDGLNTTFYMNLANDTMVSAQVTWASNTASFTGLSLPFGTEVVYGAIGVSNGGLQRGTIS